MKDVKFSMIFGCLFSAPLILIFYSENEIYLTYIPVFLAVGIIVMYMLRMFTILIEKSKKTGSDFVDKYVLGETNLEDLDSVIVIEENYLQMLLGLHFVGPYITTAFAVTPALVLVLLTSNMAGEAYQPSIYYIFGSIITAVWLILVSYWWRVKIVLPIVPIPLLWLTPFTLLFGLLELLS